MFVNLIMISFPKIFQEEVECRPANPMEALYARAKFLPQILRMRKICGSFS